MGFLYEQLNSKLKKEHYYETEWIEASDVNTFVCHIPRSEFMGGDIYPGLDYVPVFDGKYWYPDSLVKLKMPGDERRIHIARVQHVAKFQGGMAVLELYESLPDYPVMGSPVKKVFGSHENLMNEPLTEKYHKDIKTGRNLKDWADKDDSGLWLNPRKGK